MPSSPTLPSGTRRPRSTVGDANHVRSGNASLGIAATCDTISPRGHGERYDHELTIWITTNAFNPGATIRYRTKDNTVSAANVITRKHGDWWNPGKPGEPITMSTGLNNVC